MKPLLLAILLGTVTLLRAEPGADIARVFADAAEGKPLRYVAMGGSITEGGKGWIGDWLKQTFPKSEVTVVNAAIGGTGSDLGVFRLEKDVIAHDPDLVVIEFSVNDTPLSDEEAVRSMETLVVRLKSLPKPPAILVLYTAKQDGVNLRRHQAVARHYDLFDINLQAAVDEKLKTDGLPWSTFFPDAVHPNPVGHDFYRQVLIEKLTPLAQNAKSLATAEKPLPAPLSKLPLLLDATMIPFADFAREGWTTEEPKLPQEMRFTKLLVSQKPGASLSAPIRAGTIGVFFLANRSLGPFLFGLDGQIPRQIAANNSNAHFYRIYHRDLPPAEHVVNVASPQVWPEGGEYVPARLGYLLVAGRFGTEVQRAAQGPYSADRLEALKFAVPAHAKWEWTGVASLPEGTQPSASALPDDLPGEGGWKDLPVENPGWIKLQSGESIVPGVANVRLTFDSEKERTALLRVSADYFARLWLNGKVLETLTGQQGIPPNPLFLPVQLRKGRNELILSVVSGSRGHGFTVALDEE